MSQTTIKKELTPLEALFKRLCANKETQKTLLDALEKERADTLGLYGHYACAALFDDTRKADAFAAMGVHAWLDALHTTVSKF